MNTAAYVVGYLFIGFTFAATGLCVVAVVWNEVRSWRHQPSNVVTLPDRSNVRRLPTDRSAS